MGGQDFLPTGSKSHPLDAVQTLGSHPVPWVRDRAWGLLTNRRVHCGAGACACVTPLEHAVTSSCPSASLLQESRARHSCSPALKTWVGSGRSNPALPVLLTPLWAEAPQVAQLPSPSQGQHRSQGWWLPAVQLLGWPKLPQQFPLLSRAAGCHAHVLVPGSCGSTMSLEGFRASPPPYDPLEEAGAEIKGRCCLGSPGRSRNMLYSAFWEQGGKKSHLQVPPTSPGLVGTGGQCRELPPMVHPLPQAVPRALGSQGASLWMAGEKPCATHHELLNCWE